MATELEEALGQLSLATLLAAALVASGGEISISEEDFADPRLVGHQFSLTWLEENSKVVLALVPIQEEEE